MKNKENAKIETSENAIKSKTNRSKNINNIADSLKSPQRQIKDPKFLRSRNEAYLIFDKEKAEIFFETTVNPKNLQWTMQENWKNVSFSNKTDFNIRIPTSNSLFSYCLCLKYPNETDEDLYVCCHCDNCGTNVNVSTSMRTCLSRYQCFYV